MRCALFETCSFIRHMGDAVPHIMSLMTIRFCEHDKDKCVRYGLSQKIGLEEIPDNLWPNDDMKAKKILDSKLNGTNKVNFFDYSDKCLLEFHTRRS